MVGELDQARRSVNALTPEELRKLRDEIGSLLDQYRTGGALTGRGYLEVKFIPKVYPRFNQETGKIEPERREYAYAYVRRAIIDERGRVKVASVGYYGRGGVDAINAGLGEALLEAHISGGESAGDRFLIEHEFDPPLRQLANKPPATEPEHPLNDPTVTVEALERSVVFRYFQEAAPLETQQLITALRYYERDYALYKDAIEQGLQFVQSNDDLQARRARKLRKEKPPRPGTIRRKRRK